MSDSIVHGIPQARILEWVSLSLLQGIFPTQGLNPGLPNCRLILYQLSHQGSPRILEWVAYAFSRGSSWPRNQTGVSCVTGRFFTNWAVRKPIIIPQMFSHRSEISEPDMRFPRLRRWEEGHTEAPALPPWRLHKPFRQAHPLVGREQNQEELQPCSLWNRKHNHRKLDKMTRQKNMFQTKK